jgi:hypothetical protein
MEDCTIIILATFVIIFLLHVWNICDRHYDSRHYDGMHERSPLATYLSLPDNVSEQNILPKLPYYTTPDYSSHVTSYAYNMSDGDMPTLYIYNSNVKSNINCNVNSNVKSNVKSNVNSNVNSSNIEEFVPLLEKISAADVASHMSNLTVLNHKAEVLPTPMNPLYLPQIGTPIERGWLN